MSPTGHSSKVRRPVSKSAKPRAAFSSTVTAIVATLAVLLIVILLQETRPRRAVVADRLQPSDMAMLLPAGSLMAPNGWLELIGEVKPSYLVGYVSDEGVSSAALLKWNRESKAYAMTSSLSLSAGASRLHGQPTFTSLLLGTSAPNAVVAHAAEDGSDGIMVLVPSGSGYMIATKVDEEGTAGPAYFATTSSATATAFQDINEDGARDAVVTRALARDGNGTAKYVSVFAWSDDAFRYDKDLSWTLTTSARVFPEPVAPPTSTP